MQESTRYRLYVKSEIIHFQKLSTFSPNKDFFYNEHIFYGLTKMCFLWVGTICMKLWKFDEFISANKE